MTRAQAGLQSQRGAIGTIEKGKLADLLVTDGELVDEDAHVLQVFVEGQRFDYPVEDDEDDEDDDRPGRRGRRGGGR